jgi:drug/metabolite transporter (DMT)-like permease
MGAELGIALAIIAMLSWGVGDFFMQKSLRRIGDWETLFFVCLFGAVIVLPFVYSELPLVLGDIRALGFLFVASAVLLAAALLDFEALKAGKLSVVEPIWSLEVPVAAFLAFLFFGETLSLIQYVLIAVLVVGLMAVSARKGFLSRRTLERGALLAFLSAVIMGSANFFIGWAARETSPLVINFFADAFMMLVSAGVLLRRGWRKSVREIWSARSVALPMAITDNIAWIAFTYAMFLAPIGIAVALSESYIIIAVILGLAINRERLDPHQKLGLSAALIAAIVLAASIG